MSEAAPTLDLWTAEALAGGRVDADRAVCLPAADVRALARAIAALANSRGGEALVGAAMSADGHLTDTTGLPPSEADATLAAALALIDPPVGHLVRTRSVDTATGAVLVVRVRLSPSTPHLVTDEGAIPRLGPDGVRTIRSRRELDDLYARGRGERERADRLVDAMIEKLVLAHYAFYNIAFIACAHDPTGEPYRAAVDGRIAPADDPFVQTFSLAAVEPRVMPAEVEVRTAGDTGAYIRVTRSGCVAAGEVQRRPHHEQLDTVESLRVRLRALAATGVRMLANAPEAVVVPHLFVEGMRGLRLVLDERRRATTGQAPQDSLRFALTLGDASDEEYPARLADEAISRLAALFPAAG